MSRVPSKSEIRNRRITAVALVVGPVVAVLALVDLGPFADESVEDRVRVAVERFVAARDDGDFAEVCEMLTATLRREVEATSGAEPGAEPPSCAEVLDAQAQAGSDRGRAGGGEIVDVSVSGNRARVALEQTEGISQSIALELVEGEWLVSTLAR